MIEAAIFSLLLALLAGAWITYGKWRERARSAGKRNEANRKAHDIQSRVAIDPAYRERVRRFFDGT